MIADDSGEAPIPPGVDSGVRASSQRAAAPDIETALYALAARQAILAELGIMALGKRSLQALLDEAVVCIRASLEVDACAVLELLPGGASLLVRAAAGWREPIAGRHVVEAGDQSHAGYTLLSSEPVVVDDFSQETRFPCPPFLAAHGIRSGMSVIIHGRDRPYGVFNVHHERLRKFTREEVDYFQAAANVIALAAERFQTEEALRRSERLTSLGVLAAGVAHEINNPLMYVLGNLDFVRKGLSELEAAPAAGPAAEAGWAEKVRDLVDMLDKARDGGERVRRIVADLKVFSRSGGDDDPAPIDVRKVMATSINIARNEIRHRARLVVDEGEVPRVMASDSRLGQVFLNLLLNAAHAIPEGSAHRNEITVRTLTDAAGCVVIEVHDTGAGIPEEIQGKLFDPFFTTKPQGVGTGLGLAICHNIVTALGGDITVESEIGRGTCFRVTLPAAPAEALAQPAEAGPRRAPGSEPAPRGRVLIVDDEPFVAGLCRRALSSEHDVEVSTTARAALSHLESGREFDVILCDLMMPDMSGMELFELVEQRSPSVAARFVFLSGGAFTPAARSFRERVSNPFLDKPCTPEDLRVTVRERLLLARSAAL